MGRRKARPPDKGRTNVIPRVLDTHEGSNSKPYLGRSLACAVAKSVTRQSVSVYRTTVRRSLGVHRRVILAPPSPDQHNRQALQLQDLQPVRVVGHGLD